MAECEMCGSKVDRLTSSKIEGMTMKVCPNCARYGKVLQAPATQTNNFSSFKRPKKKFIDPDANKILVKNYSQLIKNGREKKGLKQEQVAKELNEKESLIHSIESGHLRPSFKTARKFEKYYGVKLIDEIPNITSESSQYVNSGEPLTMGDLLKKAMKKKK